MQNRFSQQRWCMAQRTGTKRYIANLQDLFWRYEELQARVDSASRCARKRYDNAKRLVPFCRLLQLRGGKEEGKEREDKGKESEKKRERALCRLTRHYALYLSIYHIMTLSMSLSWNSLLYCVCAISDAPLPIPTVDEDEDEQEEEKQHYYKASVYAKLHQNCRNGASATFETLLNQVDQWMTLLDENVSVDSLDEKIRPDVIVWIRENVIDPSIDQRICADNCWKTIEEQCKDPISAKEAAEEISEQKSGADSVELYSRTSTWDNGKVKKLKIHLPCLTSLKSEEKRKEKGKEEEREEEKRENAKKAIYEFLRLESALKAIGG